MSSLVDKWTEELAKLREKGQASFFGGPSPRAEPEQTSGSEEPSPLGYQYLSQALRIRPRLPPTLFSEAALSMLVDCFSP